MVLGTNAGGKSQASELLLPLHYDSHSGIDGSIDSICHGLLCAASNQLMLATAGRPWSVASQSNAPAHMLIDHRDIILNWS